MTQQEIDAMCEALRSQGLTWNQTNFAVSLVRNAVDTERERAVATERERLACEFDRRDKGVGGFYDPHEPAEIIRASPPKDATNEE